MNNNVFKRSIKRKGTIIMLYKETDIEHPYHYPYAPVPAPETPAYQPFVTPEVASSDELQPPQEPRKQKKSGWRAGAIVVLALVMLLVFGVGLFSGAVFFEKQHTNTSTATTSTTTTTSSALTQQEAAIAKVKPAVVELNVTTSQGEAIGSGVIIDKN